MAAKADAAHKAAASKANQLGYMALIAGWLIPGAGHLLLKRWGRGVLVLLSISCMFVLGILMGARLYAPNTADLLDMLAFLGDLGSGLLYLVGHGLGLGQAPVQIVTADYGAKFVVVAGLLNLISAVDAHSIAVGEEAMTLAFSHFSTVILFAIFASIIFGITQRSTPKAMARYGAYCFVMFVGAVIIASWLMYFIRH